MVSVKIHQSRCRETIRTFGTLALKHDFRAGPKTKELSTKTSVASCRFGCAAFVRRVRADAGQGAADNGSRRPKRRQHVQRRDVEGQDEPDQNREKEIENAGRQNVSATNYAVATANSWSLRARNRSLLKTLIARKGSGRTRRPQPECDA